MDIFGSAGLPGVINSSRSTLVPLYSPDVKDDLAESRRLNQSDAASCVTGRSHGYLAATATGVNVSCQTMMDEIGLKTKDRKKNPTQPQVCKHTQTHTGHTYARACTPWHTGPRWVSPQQECKWFLDGCHVASGIQLFFFFSERGGKGPRQLKWQVINKEKNRDHT